MPVWLTVAIGFAGTLIGTGIVFAIEGRSEDDSWVGDRELLAAVGLVVLYRRFVQKRPLWGKGATVSPTAASESSTTASGCGRSASTRIRSAQASVAAPAAAATGALRVRRPGA